MSDDTFNYYRAEIKKVLDAGPQDGEDWYRLVVKGKRETKHLNVTPTQVHIISALMSENWSALAALLPEAVFEARRDDVNATAEASIIDAVREVIAGWEGLDVPIVGVYFYADEWDNGWFIHTSGEAIDANGEVHSGEVDVDAHADEFGEAFGTVGSSAGVLIDLRNGELSFDDYGRANLCDPFVAGLKKQPGASDS